MGFSPHLRKHRPWRIVAVLIATLAATLALWAMLHIGPDALLQEFDEAWSGYHAAVQAMQAPRDTPPLH